MCSSSVVVVSIIIIIGAFSLEMHGELFNGMSLIEWVRSDSAPWKARQFYGQYQGTAEDAPTPPRARRNLVDALMEHAAKLCDPGRPTAKLLQSMATIIGDELPQESAVSFL